MSEAALYAQLSGGETTLARAWAITRRDGLTLGFTDHDLGLQFEGITFKPGSGLSAKALMQTTGLAVDNTEALGALSDAAISEDDIRAGRYDWAEVRIWLVNWADPDTRLMLFRGEIGEVRRGGGAFTAELRGLTEALNQPQGRVYQRACPAVLGDATCRFNLETSGFSQQVPLAERLSGRQFVFDGMANVQAGWFSRGMLRVQSGAGAGLFGVIKTDRILGTRREVELWEPLAAEIDAGDMIRLEAGCDKRAETCKAKFNNYLNFQGFPHIPGEDWLSSYPVSGPGNDGGSFGSGGTSFIDTLD